MNLFSKMLAFRSADDSSPLRKLFHESFYLARYRDVRESGISPWDHYIRFGMSEDRQPRADFDPKYYRAAHRNAVGPDSPFHHWATIGRAKGWRGHPWIDEADFDDVGTMRAEFDPAYYLSQYPSVSNA